MTETALEQRLEGKRPNVLTAAFAAAAVGGTVAALTFRLLRSQGQDQPA
jgi:hypothetical protein